MVTEKVITITAKCAEGHSQTLGVGPGLDLVWAKHLAGLMDGTSDFYVNSPRGDASSLIGKCGICGSQIDCTVEDAVDRSARTLTDGSSVTDDHREIDPATGQQKAYVVLSAEERAKGFVRPVRRTYTHVGKVTDIEGNDGSIIHRQRMGGCGSNTTMGQAIAETYARDPKFYSGTFCCHCNKHLPLDEFVWAGTIDQVGW